jgi:hypothetical protein|tara:strand:- start:370 stop:789 length:420 start_codon:yes stop_codon:yes gene_type:complete
MMAGKIQVYKGDIPDNREIRIARDEKKYTISVLNKSDEELKYFATLLGPHGFFIITEEGYYEGSQRISGFTLSMNPPEDYEQIKQDIGQIILKLPIQHRGNIGRAYTRIEDVAEYYRELSEPDLISQIPRPGNWQGELK